MGEGEVERLDLDVREAGLVQQRLDAAGRREGEHAGLVGRRGRRVEELLHLLGADGRPGVALGRIPCGERHAAAGTQDAPGLAQRRRGVGQQHVAPTAEHPVHARRREVDPLRLQELEFHAGDAELLRPAARGVEHALRGVRADQRPAGLDQLGDEEPGVPRPGRQLEHPVAGLRADRVGHPARDRHRDGLERRAAVAPARRSALPGVAGAGPVGVGIERHCR